MALTKEKKLTPSNTKQEMLDAYNDLLKEIETKKSQELKPVDIIKEKESKKVIDESNKIANSGIESIVVDLRKEFNKAILTLESQLELSYSKYETLKKGVELKEAELKEVYDIDRNANTLAALIESNNAKKAEFDDEIENEKSDLDAEIKHKRDSFLQEMNSKKEAWENEKKSYLLEIKERDSEEQKRRQREKEDFTYNFEKEKRTALDNLKLQKSTLEKEIADLKEKSDKELAERENLIAFREKEFNDLKLKALSFDKELDNAVAKAVKAATEKLVMESKHKEEILIKEIDGERKLYSAQISSLEKSIKEQNEQILKLQQQIDKSYSQVQDIAIRAVDSSSRKQNNVGQPINIEN